MFFGTPGHLTGHRGSHHALALGTGQRCRPCRLGPIPDGGGATTGAMNAADEYLSWLS